jgi:hypothetical protein
MRNDPDRGFMSNFHKSPHAAERRFFREAVKKSPLTRAQKDILAAVANLWLHHRNGPRGVIHPGREKLARITKTSVRTVASTLGMLRNAGVLTAVARPNGEGQRPTEYTMSLSAMCDLCGVEMPKHAAGELVELPQMQPKWCAISGPVVHTTLHTTMGQKLHTVITNVEAPFSPSHERRGLVH